MELTNSISMVFKHSIGLTMDRITLTIASVYCTANLTYLAKPSVICLASLKYLTDPSVYCTAKCIAKHIVYCTSKLKYHLTANLCC